MSLHEKGRAALLTGDYSLGISLFTTAENSYKSCFRTKTIFLVEISGHFTIHVLQPVLDPDPLDPQDFGFLDPDPQKYADPRIRIHEAKYQPKTATKQNFNLITQI